MCWTSDRPQATTATQIHVVVSDGGPEKHWANRFPKGVVKHKPGLDNPDSPPLMLSMWLPFLMLSWSSLT